MACHKCPHCTETFTKKPPMYKHLDEHHGDLRPHVCSRDDCTRTFETEKQLGFHLATTHNRVDLPCLYEGCSATFRMQRALNKHLHAHANPFVCPFEDCEASSKSFLEEKYLRQHVERFHGRSSVTCGKKFSRQDRVDKHQVVHNPEGTKNASLGSGQVTYVARLLQAELQLMDFSIGAPPSCSHSCASKPRDTMRRSLAPRRTLSSSLPDPLNRSLYDIILRDPELGPYTKTVYAARQSPRVVAPPPL